MKIRKQIKNRVLAVAMLAVVMLCDVSIVFASVKDYDSGNKKFLLQRQVFKGVDDPWLDDNGTQYNILYSSNLKDSDMLFRFIDVSGFPLKSGSTAQNYFVPVRKLVDGAKSFGNIAFYGNSDMPAFSNLSIASDNVRTLIDGDAQYSYSVGNFSSLDIFKCSSSRCFAVDFDELGKKYPNDNISVLIGKLLLIALGSADETSYCYSVSDSSLDDGLAGSQDNPILDSDIGTLVLKKSKCYWVGDGSMDVSQRVRWANKTDTDFSLTNNKYAITRIEVKIGNRVTYFGDVEHHGKGKKVDNFGEVYPFKYVIATDNPHDFSFKDMLSASKTDLTKYNAAMLEHEYDLYFRVVCGTAYGTSAEWHCGKWTRYRVTDDPKQDGKNESDNGHFNDNGEWEKDKDTDVDSGGIGNVDDKDDLEDDFNHFKDSENWKDWLNKEGLDLDSAKAFIDQVADVPKMIGDLFSFFPDWVKYSFALGFGLIPVIIVIKFLRG